MWDLDETVLKTATGDTLVNYGLDIVISQADSPWQPLGNSTYVPPSSRHLVVAGDTVTVRGPLRNPGKDIRIFARQLVLEADAVIDVSGPDPDPNSDYAAGNLPQQKDQSPGAVGASGAPGAPGADSGNIVITAESITWSGAAQLRARGGRGGRGQDGHAGNQGGAGGAGNDGDVLSDDGPPPGDAYGHKGGTGGSGGTPGTSGAGGKGGQVSITYMSLSAAIPIDAGGGAGGAAATGGAGGLGGTGGGGGTWYWEHWVGAAEAKPAFFPPIYKVKQPRQAPGGPTGDTGSAWPGPPTAGAAGSAGAVSWNGAAQPGQATPDYARLTPFAAVKQLLITQHAAAQGFLNAKNKDDRARVVTLFIWLGEITAAVGAGGFAPPAGWSPSDAPAAKAIGAMAQTMLARIRSGLDFYGYPKDWVPIVSLQSYVERINQLLGVGGTVEAQYRAFTAETATLDQQIAALKATRATLQGDLDNATAEIKTLNDPDNGLIGQTDRLITQLTTKIENQQKIITNDEFLFTVAFRQYIEKKANGCSFDRILQCVGTIVAIGSSAMDGVGALTAAGAAGKAAEEATLAFKDAERALKTIKTVVSSISDIEKNFNQLKTLFPADPTQTNIGLLATDKDKFDKFIAQYLDDFGAAQALKDAVDDYFAMLDARNQALLAYVAQFTQMAKLQAQSDQLVAQLEELGPDPSDPSLAIYLSFMRTAYVTVKADLTARLFEAYRAQAYWTLEDSGFSASDLDIASLATSFESLLDSIDKERLRQGGPLQPFTDVRVQISAADYPLAFKDLPQSRKLSFSLTPILGSNASDRADPFRNQYQVLATSFTIAFADIAAKSGALTLGLNHSGREVQVGTKGKTAFLSPATHAPRNTPFKIDYADPDSRSGGLIGDSYFYGLSPFAVWTLDFDFPGNEWVDLSKIGSVDLFLTGNYVGP